MNILSKLFPSGEPLDVKTHPPFVAAKGLHSQLRELPQFIELHPFNLAGNLRLQRQEWELTKLLNVWSGFLVTFDANGDMKICWQKAGDSVPGHAFDLDSGEQQQFVASMRAQAKTSS